MQRRRIYYPLRYRRARSLLIIIGLFWLWLGISGGEAIAALHSPVTAALVLYALAVSIPVTIAAAFLAAARMILTHPRRNAVVVKLPAAPKRPPGANPGENGHRWPAYSEKAS